MRIRKNKQNGITISLEEAETIHFFRETYFMSYTTLLKVINDNIKYLDKSIVDKAIQQSDKENVKGE